MKTIAITGLSGVVGEQLLNSQIGLLTEHKVIDLYNNHPTTFSDISSYQLNLLDTQAIVPSLRELNPDVVIHLASATHIDKCELDRSNGKNGTVWKINVLATEHITAYVQETGKKLIFLSSECVFDGEKTKYKESDLTQPKSWYGITKAAAEKVIMASTANAAIVRGVVAYHTGSNSSKTIFGKFKKSLQNSKPVLAVSDQHFTPTFIDDLWVVIEQIIKRNATGIFHAASQAVTTPYDFARDIAEFYNYDSSLIEKTTMKKLLGQGKASLRLKNACLDTQWTTQALQVSCKSLAQAMDNSQ